MAKINLTQEESDVLIAMEKQRINDQVWYYPKLGGAITIPLQSVDKKEKFLLDITRSRIDLAKGTYQNRVRNVVILVRLDFGGAPHRNPNGEEISTPHIHLYREGFGDKWAFPISVDNFSDVSNLWQTLKEFMEYCNIIHPPVIEKGYDNDK